MRVIGGAARGVPLAGPHGRGVRPTLERVREALFDIIGPRIEGCRFLDLYAGTGANGIEAISRGAARAVFLEEDPRMFKVLRRNLFKTKLAPRAIEYRASIPRDLRRLRGHTPPFDVVFADPPYKALDGPGLLSALREHVPLAESALVVLEHEARTVVDAAEGFERTRTSTYGDTSLSFFRQTE